MRRDAIELLLWKNSTEQLDEIAYSSPVNGSWRLDSITSLAVKWPFLARKQRPATQSNRTDGHGNVKPLDQRRREIEIRPEAGQNTARSHQDHQEIQWLAAVQFSKTEAEKGSYINCKSNKPESVTNRFPFKGENIVNKHVKYPKYCLTKSSIQ
ncbi:MAG: hypothetical protein AAF636_22480 [Pseudomonadota bacterium]